MRPRWCAVLTEARKQSLFGRDFAQFYERMEHHILQANAKSFGFPLPVLRDAVSAYRMQRVLVLHGEAAPTEHPSRGVVAGSAIATYLVKLYGLLVLDNVVRLHPPGGARCFYR